MLAACATGTSDTAAPMEGVELLTPREQLIRVSLDLRGVLPSEEELEAVEETPGYYQDYVDRWLEDPRLERRVRFMLDERFRMRTDEMWLDPEDMGLTGVSDAEASAVMTEEALRFASWLVVNDMPWTDLVTAEYTLADELLAELYSLERQEGDGWTPATYTDGRPHAGILSMNAMWQRFPSMGGNANRHRANAVSKTLLCDDYLSRPIVLNRAAVDQLVEDPEDAISSNTSCQSCHSTLDPLAAHFFGFFHEDEPDDPMESLTYRPENEEMWREYADKEPAWYGTPTTSLFELGEYLAMDPRFSDCAVRTFYESLNQRDIEDADWEELQSYTATFSEGFLVKPLIRDIVLSENYRAASSWDPELEERLVTARTVSPDQLASLLEERTGVSWDFGGTNGLTEPGSNLAILLGGVDAENDAGRSYEPSVGLVFVQERLAQSVAWQVAQHDLDPDRDGAPILLSMVSATDTPESSPAEFQAQIRGLYRTLTGVPLESDATEPEALAQAWKELYAVTASPTRSWAGVISVVIRDPRLVLY